MKRTHFKIKHVEREVPDDVDVNYHLGRLMKVISVIFFLFLTALAILPHATESIDGNITIQFWLFFSFILLPASLFAISRFKKIINGK